MSVRTPPALQCRRAALALLLTAAAAGAALQLTPTRPLAAVLGDFQLESMIPKRFGPWRVEASGGVVSIVNPQQEQLLKQLYSQTLARVYVNDKGQRVFLSIAYGNDQRDDMQMHYPEICYPAQGFQLQSNRLGQLEAAGRTLPVRRLETSGAHQYSEPVTYWTVIGDRVVMGGMNKKLAELHYGLRGLIPDGMLVRMSSPDRDAVRAFALHADFARAMLESLSPAQRDRVAGKAGR